jgi:hypothetical protein
MLVEAVHNGVPSVSEACYPVVHVGEHGDLDLGVWVVEVGVESGGIQAATTIRRMRDLQAFGDVVYSFIYIQFWVVPGLNDQGYRMALELIQVVTKRSEAKIRTTMIRATWPAGSLRIWSYDHRQLRDFGNRSTGAYKVIFAQE